MGKIIQLDKHTAELIAAGEVVERPASVVKELVENAIDAGATNITVEIQNGGITSIKISDNGSGIAREDVPIAFLRHATSKIRAEQDLERIGTLGFRGEALASIAAVSRVEMITRTDEEMAGTRYLIEGGEEVALEDIGCPKGTTIFVRDIFYNVPARMKFLKSDAGEGNTVSGVIDRLALSNPGVSFRFIRDGHERLLTPGDGDLLNCVYAVFGKEFASELIPVSYSLGGVRVSGYVSKPTACRANRSMQHFFINGRYVRTRTGMAALEQAYQGSIMSGKFPSCVLHVDMPLETVDANVHPAKIEVRFINEKPVFDAIYHGVKSAITAGDRPKQVVLKPSEPAPRPAAPPAEQTRFPLPTSRVIPPSPMVTTPKIAEHKPISQPTTSFGSLPLRDSFGSLAPMGPVVIPPVPMGPEPQVKAAEPASKPSKKPSNQDEQPVRNTPVATPDPTPAAQVSETAAAPVEQEPVIYVGEAFQTYVIAQRGNSLFLIDKHAAHERMLYIQLKESPHTEAQLLLEPVAVSLNREEYGALLPHLDQLNRAGFEAEDFGGAILVRAVPMMLSGEDVPELLREIAGGFLSGKQDIQVDKLDWIFHSVACRAAVKAGDRQSPEELAALAEQVLNDPRIRYCPHGRPVCVELTRQQLEKQFGRMV